MAKKVTDQKYTEKGSGMVFFDCFFVVADLIMIMRSGGCLKK